MKLVRYGRPGKEKPGVVDHEGRVRDLSGVIHDIDGSTLDAKTLKRLSKIKTSRLPVVRGTPRFGPCVGDVRTFIAVGLNYADHAAETGAKIPEEPILFNKISSCIVGPNDDVMLPKGSKKSDWEVELCIVIGERASYVSKKDALDVVAGFCICNDVSEREFQAERGGQWMKGKCAPTFGPIGPWMVTKDEIADVQKLSMWLDVNGERMQTGSTKTMIFDVRHVVSYISEFMTLMPGDLITTGTPPGVGLGMKPPKYLRAGDVMALGIEGLGEQRQQVVAYKAS